MLAHLVCFPSTFTFAVFVCTLVLSLSLIFDFFFLISMMFFFNIFFKIGEVVDGPDDNLRRPVLDGIEYDHGQNLVFFDNFNMVDHLSISFNFFLVISNDSVFYSVVTQYLMLILEMGNLFVSCPTIDQVFFSWSCFPVVDYNCNICCSSFSFPPYIYTHTHSHTHTPDGS